MLGPSNLETNVQCFNDVHSLEWRAYVLSADAYRKAKDPQNAAFEPLAAACCKFRQNGYLSYDDTNAKVLWTFRLPDSCHRPVSLERVFLTYEEIASQHLLYQAESSILQASDLEAFARRPLQSATSNLSSQSSNLASAAVETTDGTENVPKTGVSTLKFGRHEVHDAFILAVLESLSYHLITKSALIPLCFNTFVSNYHDSHDDATYDSKRNDSAMHNVNTSNFLRGRLAWTIGAEWLPDGRLILAQWRGCTSYVPLLKWNESLGPKAQREALLAPIGRRIPASRIKVLSDRSPKNSFKVRQTRQHRESEAVIEALGYKGLVLQNPDTWVLCDFHEASDPDEVDARSSNFIWPAELVYLVVSPTAKDQESIWSDPRLAEDPFSLITALDDPQTPEQMEEDESNTPKYETQPLLPDMYAEILTEILGFNSASGVYPTPPELGKPPSNLHRDHPQFSAPTPATISSGPGYGPEGDGFLPENHEDVFVSVGDAMDADDLFGDMEMELGGDTLNEDEFGFFDTSKREDPEVLLQPEHERSQMSLKEDLTEHTSKMKDKTVTFESQEADAKTLPTVDANLLSGEVSKSSNVEMKPDVKMPQPLLLEANQLASRNVGGRPTKPMDEKYKTGGFFEASKTSGPAMHDPRIQLPSRPAIPIITITDKNVPSTESNSSVSNAGSDDTSESSSDDEEDRRTEDDMEGVVSSQTSSSLTTGKDDESSDFSIIELASRRMPILAFSLGTRIDQFHRLSAILDLNGEQYIELSQLVAQQVCYTSSESHSLSDVSLKRRQEPSLIGANFLGFGNEGRRDNSSVSSIRSHRQRTLTLGEHFVPLEKTSLQLCASFDAGVTFSSTSTAQTPIHEMHDRYFPMESTFGENPTHLQIPELSFRKDETKVIMSATALDLWAELGLSPDGGSRNILAFCLVPGLDPWTRGASRFLEAMGESFSSLRLGSHKSGRVTLNNEKRDPGILPVESTSTFQAYFQGLCRSLSGFGQSLLRGRSAGFVVIYIVNPSDDISLIPFFCTAFQKLQRLLASKQANVQQNLILRVIPRSLIVQKVAFDLPSTREMKKLAWEIYDRCAQSERQSGSARSLTQLARPLPRSMRFHLHSNMTRRPLERPVVTHVAYSWRPGNVWISFAFCDESGGRRWHNSYHLPWEKSQWQGPKPDHSQDSTQQQPYAGMSASFSANNPSATAPGIWQRFVGVARDVLVSLAEISEDLMQGQPHTHHVLLVKDGPITREEKYVWRSLMEKTAKPNGVAGILGGSSNPSINPHAAVVMSWTVAVLDCECPIQVSSSSNESTDSMFGFASTAGGPGMGSAIDSARPWPQDLPASTPGTPSLASPGGGLHSGGLTGSFPRDTEDHSARLVTPRSLAWFVPARSILAQSYIGKLEVLPTPTMPHNPATTPGGMRVGTAASGGGYMIMNRSCEGDDDDDDEDDGNDNDADEEQRRDGGDGVESGRPKKKTKKKNKDKKSKRPRVLSLRIVAAKAPSLLDLRQLAEAYRALASVSEVYGLDATLPWHVAMARGARSGLGRCM